MARSQMEMYKQIISVFGDPDSPYYAQDIVEMCEKKMAYNSKRSQKSQYKVECVRNCIKKYTDSSQQRSAKELASELIEEMPQERWTTQGVSYYLRQLVAQGVVEECGKSPKTYIYVGEE